MTGVPSLLATALILDALAIVPDEPLLAEIKDKAARYLLSAKNSDWIFPVPLGTTCIILAALTKYNRELVEGRALANLLLTLTGHEVQEGGPYKTNILVSLVGQESLPPIDVGANAAIGYFLAGQSVRLPQLSAFIDQAQLHNKFESNEFGATLVQRLVSKVSGRPARLQSQTSGLEQTPAVAMAWAIEDSGVATIPLVENIVPDIAEAQMFELIKQEARGRFSVLADELQQLALGQLEKSVAGNSNKQMSLMPFYFREALGEKGKMFSDVYIARLGLANILFWTAFIIYDDFWDKDEAALPHLLPTANVYAREFIKFFTEILAPASGLQAFFHALMDKLDAANTWETLHCRTAVADSFFKRPFCLPEFDDYEKKYEPASAHILGSVVLFYQLGFPIGSEEMNALISYFRNYLIPMQINDDLHDWQEDMTRGHLSTVVTMLLEDLGSDREQIDLVNDMAELEYMFWSKTLPRAGALAHNYLDKARTALYSLSIIENRAPLERFIIGIEQSIDAALKERDLVSDFLKYFEVSRPR